MQKLIPLFIIAIAILSCSSSKQHRSGNWVSLFDGKTLNGWKVGANAETFRVENGAIVANGNTAHLFYDGPVMNHQFKNFELKSQVLTFPGSNSGIYFQTRSATGCHL